MHGAESPGLVTKVYTGPLAHGLRRHILDHPLQGSAHEPTPHGAHGAARRVPLWTMAWLWSRQRSRGSSSPETLSAGGQSLPRRRGHPRFRSGFGPTIRARRPAARGRARRHGLDSRRRFFDGRRDPSDPQDVVGMQATRDSRPIHRVSVDGFWMDRTEVTNDSSPLSPRDGYVTIAERTPRAEIPRGAARAARGRLLVFRRRHTPCARQRTAMVDVYEGARTGVIRSDGAARLREGRLSGRASGLRGCGSYVKWAGSALPTEAEWGFAARGGLSASSIPGVTRSAMGGDRWTNRHHGHFPDPTRKRWLPGHRAVRAVSAERYGLVDVAGNVWEWGSDWIARTTTRAPANDVGPQPAPVPHRRPIRTSLESPSAYTAAARSSAPISTVRDTWWARAGRAKFGRDENTSVKGGAAPAPQ